MTAPKTPVTCPRCHQVTLTTRTEQTPTRGRQHQFVYRVTVRTVWECTACGFRPLRPSRRRTARLF